MKPSAVVLNYNLPIPNKVMILKNRPHIVHRLTITSEQVMTFAQKELGEYRDYPRFLSVESIRIEVDYHDEADTFHFVLSATYTKESPEGRRSRHTINELFLYGRDYPEHEALILKALIGHMLEQGQSGNRRNILEHNSLHLQRKKRHYLARPFRPLRSNDEMV